MSDDPNEEYSDPVYNPQPGDGEDPTPTTPPPDESTSFPENLSPGPGAVPAASSIIKASDDPVMALLDRFSVPNVMEQPGAEKMIRHEVRCVSLTVAELKMAIARNPGHEVAHVFAGAVQNLKDTESIAVEQPDLQALIQNGKVRTTLVNRGGTIVRGKICE